MITSASNQRVKNLVNLIQKSKARREQDVFITEGVKMFLEAAPEMIKEVYVSESFYEKGTAREKLEQCNYEVLSDELFKKVSDTQTPQGVLCVMKQFHYKLEDLFQKENPLFLILEDIQDPGNLGTMVRTAEGAGVDGVIMTKATVDIYNPKTIRSTMGSIYRMPFLYTDDLLGNLENIIGHTMETAGVKYEKFLTSLRNCYEIVEANRIELNPPVEEPRAAAAAEKEVKAENVEDYRVDVSPEDFE